MAIRVHGVSTPIYASPEPEGQPETDSTKVVQADAGIRPYITLRSVLSKNDITSPVGLTRSECCNSPTIFEVSSDKQPKQIQNELHDIVLSMKWQLYLKWKTERQKNTNNYCGSNQELVRLVPCVKMVPDSDIQEKLGDVIILPGYVVVCVDGRRRQMMTPSNPDNVMIMRKGWDFESDLTSLDELAITVNLASCEREIAIEVEIILIRASLNIIEPVKVPSCDILQIFGNLLAQNEGESKEKFCDIKLTASEQQEEENPKLVNFYAHKAILAIRSPVFARMLSHDMKESATNTIKLPDIEPAVLNELLIYIYTNECPNIKSYAASLLYNAEKYGLNHLKALCEQRLSFDLQIENAAKTLLLADTCGASQLKRNTLLFIGKHGGQVLATKDWEDVKPNAELLQELLSTTFEPPTKKKRSSTNWL